MSVLVLCRNGQAEDRLLAEADHALRTAQAQKANTWACRREANTDPVGVHGRQAWQSITNPSHSWSAVFCFMANRWWRLIIRSGILHKEIFDASTGSGRSGVERRTIHAYGRGAGIWHRDLDRIVLDKTLERLSRHSVPLWSIFQWLHCEIKLFYKDLCKVLNVWPEQKIRLFLNCPNLVRCVSLEGLRDFVAQVRALGHGFGLDHFGRGFSAFGYLQSLRPDYVKIDGAYTRQLAEDWDNEFFVSTLCSVAHSLDMLTIAEAVEDQAQWDALKKLNVDGIQGYVVSPPSPLDEEDVVLRLQNIVLFHH